MPQSGAKFYVYQFFVGGNVEPPVRALDPIEAVRLASALTKTLGASIGSTCRIVITNAEDHVVWEWRYGEGLIFPELQPKG